MSRHGTARLCASLALAVGLTTAAGPLARAATPAPDAAALTAERGHLRAELDRVNAEIDALKKAGRGVGDDYRLRARLADAEALARRLIDIEARLGLRGPASNPVPLPVIAATDGPSDLEAKADILVDQSRRVRREADALVRRVGQIKGRQNLRWRMDELDRDPFAPLEGSKRRVASLAGPDNAIREAGPGATSGINSGSMPQTGAARPGTIPTTGASGGPGGSVSVTISGTTGTTSLSPPAPVAGAPTTALTLELRDLLDPATVADIRRIEAAKGPATSVQALERAVAALRARANALDGQARAMRQAARTR